MSSPSDFSGSPLNSRCKARARNCRYKTSVGDWPSHSDSKCLCGRLTTYVPSTTEVPLILRDRPCCPGTRASCAAVQGIGRNTFCGIIREKPSCFSAERIPLDRKTLNSRGRELLSCQHIYGGKIHTHAGPCQNVPEPCCSDGQECRVLWQSEHP